MLDSLKEVINATSGGQEEESCPEEFLFEFANEENGLNLFQNPMTRFLKPSTSKERDR